LDHLGGVRQKPISQMKDITKDIITIKESETAMTAFQTMINKNISGLAIVNDEGKLSGSISLRDLKVISVLRKIKLKALSWRSTTWRRAES